MRKMLVAITYGQDGKRSIADLYFNDALNDETYKTISGNWAEFSDEIYIVDFDPNSQDFINEIVTNGCRI